MRSMKIGVILDSFKTDLPTSLAQAVRIGATGVQIHAIGSLVDLDYYDCHRRKELLDRIKSSGLEVSAICGDLGGHGFSIREMNKNRIERSKRILDFAKDLECSIVTTHIGVVPDDKSHDRWSILQEACEELGRYSASLDGFYAIETGPEKSQTLKCFIDSLHTRGIAVNMDPANLVMVIGENPSDSVRTLGNLIVHTHAKDGRMVTKGDAETIYGHFANGGISNLHLEDYFQEVPLGEGTVDFDSYLAALRDIGYHGFLTIEREVGETPERDIQNAVAYLRKKLQESGL